MLSLSPRKTLLLSASVLSLAVAALPGQAAVIFNGSGTNPESGGGSVSGSAQFSVSGNTLTVVLTNSSAAATPVRADALTGLAWNITGASPILTLSSIQLTNPSAGAGQDKIFTSKTASNTSDPLSGSWTNQIGSTPISQYGVATTGFNGAFAAGGISLGTGGTNYGIVSDGTFPNASASSSFNSSAFPLIQNSLMFTFTGATGLTDTQFTSVKFLYGTSGQGVVTGSSDGGIGLAAVPEPGSVALLVGMGVLGSVLALRRRR